jgi:hypothetical protein
LIAYKNDPRLEEATDSVQDRSRTYVIGGEIENPFLVITCYPYEIFAIGQNSATIRRKFVMPILSHSSFGEPAIEKLRQEYFFLWSVMLRHINSPILGGQKVSWIPT